MHDPRNLGSVTPDDFRRIREVFESALERRGDERRAFVEEAFGGNTLLVAEVERMLAAEETRHSLLDAPARVGAPRGVVECASCRAPIEPGHRFCPACGTPTHGSGTAEGRFRAGALFANRFRIVGRLGHGGMGEVYRADDLEVGQPVALKFLTAFRSDERARLRLRSEVRLARQISHPNVCRVYDIGESQGELYLSMEYVDGEDLAALLKRIGRLPIDKGIEIARKLCAGLAAAHAKGVLHRDFKPANIMIDGHGEVRIMDFGLAAIASELEANDVRSGTPAYMAPEQLAGKEATKQSDLYALGLVLYELFTGKAAFEAKSLEDSLRLRESGPATTPSTLIPELSPRLERAILKCLEPDSKQRPGSALEVSASLPGGDPLAEALAAGETPSPEMVAAAGPVESVRPRAALTILATTLATLVVVVGLSPATQFLAKLPFSASPEELTIRARDIARAIGYSAPVVDTAAGFRFDPRYVEYMTGTREDSRRNWDDGVRATPGPLSFWYRQSSATLLASAPFLGFQDQVPYDPLTNRPATLLVEVNLDGRLGRLVAPAGSSVESSSVEPNWTALFTAAGFDITKFSGVEPRAGLDLVHDQRLAWTGETPDSNHAPIRVEAASFRGATTYFEVVTPWATSRLPEDAPRAARAQVALQFLLFTVLAFVARHQSKSGRGDTRGAWRVGLYRFGMGLLLTTLAAHNIGLVAFGPTGPAFAILDGLATATAYLALEPLVRRHRPQALITWSRLLMGRWTDVSVARDLALGICCATIVHLVIRSGQWLAVSQGTFPAYPVETMSITLDSLRGGRLLAATVVGCFQQSLNVLPFLFVMLIARLVLKRMWLASVAAVAFWVVIAGSPSLIAGNWVAFVGWMIELSALAFVIVRSGLLAGVGFIAASLLIRMLVVTSDLGAWYGQGTLVAVTLITLMAVWTFWMSLGGRPALAFARAGEGR